MTAFYLGRYLCASQQMDTVSALMLLCWLPALIRQKNRRVLDMGAGVGAVSLAMCQRLGCGHITAIEKDPFCAELLAYNIAENNLSEAIRPVQGDINQMPVMLRASFDAVIANPPFHHASDKNPRSRRRSLAHNGDGESSLCDWVKSGLWALRDKGRLTFIIRADRTDEVMAALHSGGAGEILLYPLWSYATSPAVRMIITARKGLRALWRCCLGWSCIGLPGL